MSIVDEEKIAFKKLIDIKDKLYVELRDYKMEAQQKILDKKVDNSRKGGITIVEEEIIEKDIVVVDSREFSSMTPVYLHEKGFWMIPMVLTVGDYVLSDDICIERKSVLTGDLFESFRSGRLLQ